ESLDRGRHIGGNAVGGELDVVRATTPAPEIDHITRFYGQLGGILLVGGSLKHHLHFVRRAPGGGSRRRRGGRLCGRGRCRGGLVRRLLLTAAGRHHQGQPRRQGFHAHRSSCLQKRGRCSNRRYPPAAAGACEPFHKAL